MGDLERRQHARHRVVVLERWASELGVGLRLEPGAEAELIERLHARELDVVAAGLFSAF